MAGVQNARIKFKTGTTQEWATVENTFTPKLGELCIYMDYIETDKENEQGQKLYKPGIKIGLGNTLISQLPFLSENYITNSEIDTIVGLVPRVNVLGEGRLGAFILGENADSNLLDATILDSLMLG